jgi:hypothetical protein
MRTIRFYKEPDSKWFADIPEWEGEKWELEMVMGADMMLDILAQGEGEIALTLSEKEFAGSEPLIFSKYSESGEGAWYSINELSGISFGFDIWLCDVTKFVFGNFPRTIWISK